MSIEETIELTQQRLRGLPIVSAIIARLQKELSRDLYYHCAAHTEEVLRHSLELAILEGNSERDLELLAIAAAYHDSGYLVSPVDNEAIGAENACQAMMRAGSYTESEIDAVEIMILDTSMHHYQHGAHQTASIALSKYLLDADLGNLGREDFLEKNEQLRKELGVPRPLFLKKTLELLQSHRWHSHIAEQRYAETKRKNVQLSRDLLARQGEELEKNDSIAIERMTFLTKLPLLLNSSLNAQEVISRALEHLKSKLGAEATTLFMKEPGKEELTFWATQGGEGKRLQGVKMPAGRGVVGWVIQQNESAVIADVTKDPRFFQTIDREGGFVTRDMICVPLSVRGGKPFGAVQVLNRSDPKASPGEDLLFTEQFSSHLSLAVDNAVLHSQLRERSIALEVLERRKNDIVTVIAHEFRTPLNIIQNSADMLAGNLVRNDAEREKMGATLARGVERLSKLVSQVKRVSAITSEDVEIDCEPVEVAQLFHYLREEFESVARSRQLVLQFQGEELNARVSADPTLIRIVLRNLVANAIRFTPDKGTITVRAQSRAQMIELSVEDTGIGIAPEHYGLIFEKFFEVGDVLNHSSGEFEFRSAGLGLGLVTTKSIMDAHHSSITVRSEIGKGSIFAFCLPQLSS